MEFTDKTLVCARCRAEFIFSAAEQSYFREKSLMNEPRQCKKCKAMRRAGLKTVRFESRVSCAECRAETVVPFRPRHGKPVFCRDCFRKRPQMAERPS